SCVEDGVRRRAPREGFGSAGDAADPFVPWPAPGLRRSVSGITPGQGGPSMTGAVLVRWGANIPGRERKGLEVFGRAIARFEQLAKQGRIHSHSEYIALTGEVGGF